MLSNKHSTTSSRKLSPIFTKPVKGKPFCLCPDTSGHAVGAALEQEGKDGQWHVVAYGSRSLTNAERKWSSMEKECFSVVYFSQIPNLDCHVATMTIPAQVSVPSTFFASSSNYYSFKMQAGCYSCKNLTLEMDLSNTSSRLCPAITCVVTASGSPLGGGYPADLIW